MSIACCTPHIRLTPLLDHLLTSPLHLFEIIIRDEIGVIECGFGLILVLFETQITMGQMTGLVLVMTGILVIITI